MKGSDLMLSRRGFLGGALAAAGVAALGVAGCASSAGEGGEPDASSAASSWRTAPEPIPASEITAEYTADVVVVGAGHAGSSCARSAAESGCTVILVEEQPEEAYVVFGHEFGSVNSRYMTETLGYPVLDRAEVYNDWMSRNAYRANPALIKAYVDRSGETFDWIIDLLDDEFVASFSTNGLPASPNYSGEQNNQKTWPGSMEMWDSITVHKAQHAKMLSENPENKILWGHAGQQLVKEDGRVVALIATDPEGNYVRINANVGVVMATGGFTGNADMCRDIYQNIVGHYPPAMRATVDISYPMPRYGKGHQMCVWAGAQWEPDEPASMAEQNPCGYNPFGFLAINGITCVKAALGNLWLNAEGKRYTNEGGDFELAGLEGRFQPQNEDGTYTVMSVFDSSLFEDLAYQQMGHATNCLADEVVGDQIKASMLAEMQATIDAGEEGYVTQFGMMYGMTTFAADTHEQLADRMGLAGEVKENFLASIARYNELCEKGYDEDFFKDADLMLPINQPPYFGYKANYRLTVGLTTLSGMWTDGNQCCLDENMQRIEGLYATGNVCGRRWIGQYTTSISGQSVGMANTLGKVLGEHLAQIK